MAIGLIRCTIFFGAAAEEVPELDLLEFLSDWQALDGELLEPWMFEDREPTQPQATVEETDEHQ
jgi:hypothetical protein